MILFKNNASSTLANELTVQSVGYVDTISLPSGHGYLFPEVTTGDNNYFVVTVVAPNADREIMKCTNRNVDTLTVTRGYESTIPKAFPIGSVIENRMTAGSINELMNITYATNAEVNAGSVANKVVTPASLHQRQATESLSGLVPLASNADALAGTDVVKAMTPARVKEAILQHVPYASTDAAGKIEIATQDEVNAGTDAIRVVTPATLAPRINEAAQWQGSSRTISTAAPSGGDNGDFWFQYIA